MRLKNWLHQIFTDGNKRRLRMHRSASRNRQRILLRPWTIEPLEDRAMLAALSGLHSIGPTGEFSTIGAASVPSKPTASMAR